MKDRPAVPDDLTALIDDVRQMRDDVDTLTDRVASAHDLVSELLDAERQRASERAALAGIPRPRLLSSAIALGGRPTERMRIVRLRAGDPVQTPFRSTAGVIRCATEAPDVRALWERLLANEAAHEDDMLRGQPSTILDIPDAAVSKDDRSLHIALERHTGAAALVGVPRFTYDYPPRKIYNFGHWLLDCLPQVVALSTVAPDARYLLPDPCTEFQEKTLALVGIERSQLAPWDGSTIHCRRLLAFESDGRTGGGRPLSALMQVRQVLAARASGVTTPRRRVYFSRRDARPDRRWTTNEALVERLFEARGFEVVSVRTHPLEQLVQIFAEARVVAGVNGAGLAHILFSPPGTHVILLFSDSLMRWHATEGGARSEWLDARRPADQISALGDSPRVYAHVAAAFNQVSHAFVGGDEMPLDRLGAFLDDVLEGVGRD